MNTPVQQDGVNYYGMVSGQTYRMWVDSTSLTNAQIVQLLAGEGFTSIQIVPHPPADWPEFSPPLFSLPGDTFAAVTAIYSGSSATIHAILSDADHSAVSAIFILYAVTNAVTISWAPILIGAGTLAVAAVAYRAWSRGRR